MNAKTVLFLLLGMCVSFGIVLYVMFAVLLPESPRPGPRRAAQVRRAKPPEPMPDRPAARSGQVTRGVAPRAGAAPSAAPPAGPVPGSAASPQITQLKQQLDQQILLLKKERDQMLSELVRQLAAMPASATSLTFVGLADVGTARAPAT